MLHASTLAFLDEIKRNNNRDWFALNRPRYEEAKEDVLALGTRLIDRINEFDPTLGAIDPRKAMFRINRDTRFSSNKEPYKCNMGMALTPGGASRTLYSCYYIHIEPQHCMLATGVYMPQPPVLKAIRRFIDDEQQEFLEIVGAKDFRREFGDLNREGKVLKRLPSGFEPDSAVAEYLKLTNFFVECPISDELICSDSFIDQACRIFEASMPLNRLLNRAIFDMD